MRTTHRIKMITLVPPGMTVTNALDPKAVAHPVIALAVLDGNDRDDCDVVEPMYLHDEGFICTAQTQTSEQFIWSESMGSEAERVEYAKSLYEEWRKDLDAKKKSTRN